MDTNTILLTVGVVGICILAVEIRRANELKELEIENAKSGQKAQLLAQFAGGVIGSVASTTISAAA